jgi:hypothetical protein
MGEQRKFAAATHAHEGADGVSKTTAPFGTASASSTALLTGHQAAEYLAVSVDSLSYWRTIGRGPAYVKFTRARQGIVRYRREDLERFVSSCIQSSTSDGADAR